MERFKFGFTLVMKIFVSALSVLIIGILMTACGSVGDSNPTQKYEQIRKNSIPEKPTVTREQSYVGSDIYTIRPESNLAFITGQLGEIKIKAMLQIPGAQYQLISHDLPEGAVLVQDPSNPMFVTLRWLPSADVVPRGQRETKGEFRVSLVVLSLPDPQSEILLKTISTETTLQYTVSMAQDRPRILAVSGLSDQIIEGSIENFTVEVEDLISNESNPPKLEIYYKGPESGEGTKINGTMFVSVKGAAVKDDENKKWIFSLTFDSKTLAVPEFSFEGKLSSSPTLDITFYLKVISANAAISAEEKVDRKIKYNKLIAKPQYSIDPKSIEIAQGSLLHLTFSTILTNHFGTLAIKLDDSVSTWAGQPTLICDPPVQSEVGVQACDFSWKVPSDIKEGDYVLKVMAGADYNGQTSSEVLIKTIKVKKADVCQPPKVEKESVPSKPVMSKSAVKKPAVSKPVTKKLKKK